MGRRRSVYKPTMLSDKQIKRFQEIWVKLFGEEISPEEADKEGSRLARIVRLIDEPETTGGDEGIKKPQENQQ